VSRSDMLAYGVTLPNSFPIITFSDFLNSTPQLASNLAGLLLFGGGQTMFGIGVISSSLEATLTRSKGSVLLRASMRSLDGLPASLHVGQKYPILTAGYFGPASFSTPGATTFRPPPSFQFEDLGLAVKATPHMQGTEAVTVTLETEFKLLVNGQSLNGVPVISNRSLKSETMLKMGEWAVVAGLMEDQDARTIAGIAGLSSIPLLGTLMRNTTHNTEGDEVLVMIRPTLLTKPPDESDEREYRMGSETRPLTPL
jgi:general secretion pathway protein D